MQTGHTNHVPTNRSLFFWLQAVIFVLPFLIYSNTIGHEYALDDAMVITHNDFTQKGLKGLKEIFTQDSFHGYFSEKEVSLPGGRYRPLSIATFAAEHTIFGPNPHISHLINIILYAFTGVLLFCMLRLLFNTKEDEVPVLLNIPVMATFLFMVHPIHTEVVANIKGRDEILSLLFSLLACISAIKYTDSRRWSWLPAGIVFLFLALLAKENAITFILIIPLSIYFFRASPFRYIVISSVPAVAAVIAWFLIRQAVVGGFQLNAAGELMNNPFLHAGIAHKYATIMLTLGIYLKLLLWPHPLTFDYYPYHIPLTGWLDPGVVLSLAVYVFMVIYAVIRIRDKKPASYSILFFLISLLPVSNLLVNMGTFMNERFVFQASIGFVTGISGFMLLIVERQSPQNSRLRQKIMSVVFSLILLTFSILAFVRNFAWKDDYTLFLNDVKTSANSAKSNCGAGGALIEKAMATKDVQERNEYLERSFLYLARAVAIDSTYSDVWRKLGTASYELHHNVPAAFRYYSKAVSINAGDELAYKDIHFILMHYGKTDQVIDMYERLLKINPGRPDVHAQLGLLFGKHKKNYPAAIQYFNNAVKIKPDYKEAYKGLGVAYQMTGDYDASLHWLQYALQLDSLDASIYKLMGTSSYKSGNMEMARIFFARSEELKKQVPVK